MRVPAVILFCFFSMGKDGEVGRYRMVGIYLSYHREVRDVVCPKKSHGLLRSQFPHASKVNNDDNRLQ